MKGGDPFATMTAAVFLSSLLCIASDDRDFCSFSFLAALTPCHRCMLCFEIVIAVETRAESVEIASEASLRESIDLWRSG
jgi:hypothetical protein